MKAPPSDQLSLDLALELALSLTVAMEMDTMTAWRQLAAARLSCSWPWATSTRYVKGASVIRLPLKSDN